MKRNGFIATSLLISFFVIFLTMSLMILATYTQYQGLINSLNENILSDLNDKVIIKKYVVVSNYVNNGDIVNGSISSWSGNNVTGINDTANNNTYIRMNLGESRVSQSIDKISRGYRTLLVRFDVFRSNDIGSSHCNNSKVTVDGKPLEKDFIDNVYYGASGYGLCGGPEMWGTHQFIVKVDDRSVHTIEFNSNIVASSYASHIDLNTIYIGIRNVMIVDISDVYRNSGTDDESVGEYFKNNVPYFNGNYTLKSI